MPGKPGRPTKRPTVAKLRVLQNQGKTHPCPKAFEDAMVFLEHRLSCSFQLDDQELVANPVDNTDSNHDSNYNETNIGEKRKEREEAGKLKVFAKKKEKDLKIFARSRKEQSFSAHFACLL